MGYYILKSNQIQSYTYRTYIRKPLKHLKKAERILTNTNTKTLKQNELLDYQLTVNLNEVLINATDNIINKALRPQKFHPFLSKNFIVQ